MFEQEISGFMVRFISADKLGGFPMTGENDAAVAEVYSGDELVSTAWIVVKANGEISAEVW